MSSQKSKQKKTRRRRKKGSTKNERETATFWTKLTNSPASSSIRKILKSLGFLVMLVSVYSSTQFIPSKIAVSPLEVINGQEAWIEISNQSHFSISNIKVSYQNNPPNWRPDILRIRTEYESPDALILEPNQSTTIEMRPVTQNNPGNLEDLEIDIDIIVSYEYFFVEHEQSFRFKGLTSNGKIVAWVPLGSGKNTSPELGLKISKSKTFLIKGKDGKLHPFSIRLKSIGTSKTKEN